MIPYPAARTGRINRTTAETSIELSLTIDGEGQADIVTGVGILDHFLTLFARHGLFDLTVRATGDLHIDSHHTVEDVAICLGQALRSALGDGRGLRRTASRVMPMDEALTTVAVDLGGRSYCVVRGDWATPMVGGIESDLVRHFFDSLAREARLNLHILLHYGSNTHHQAEAAFKGFARALDEATQRDPRLGDRLPSTKEHIETA
jgi:imidazoleglycerol-phosphate dehydratase